MFQGTVGSVCELTGYTGLRVQGYSLVFHLQGTGSTECPLAVREYLVQELRRLKSRNLLDMPYATMDAEKIIGDSSTAVTLVQGLVPAGAPAGERFDVEVAALEGTQTISLQGGVLMPTRLQVVVAGQGAGMLAARATATAEGPVFINPFPQGPEAAPKADPRRGVVLGGGRTRYDRDIRLALLQPDYRTAQQIQNRINGRFQRPGDPRAAEATREMVQLRVPETYRDRYGHFVSLVWALFLQDRAGFQDRKLAELNEAVAKPDADYEAIALAWEAIGKPALPQLERLYLQPQLGEPAYWAARVALNLDDRRVIDVLIRLASDTNHPSRLRAAQALAEVPDDPRARIALHQLLGQNDYRLRLLGYEGLRKGRDATVSSSPLGQDFALDVVDVPGQPIVAVWATVEPRIILFGKDLRLPPNVFFSSSDESVTLNARSGDEQMTVTRKLAGGNRLVTAKSSFVPADLIRLLAAGQEGGDRGGAVPPLSFSQLAGVLYQLCQQEVLAARFQLHRLPEDLVR